MIRIKQTLINATDKVGGLLGVSYSVAHAFTSLFVSIVGAVLILAGPDVTASVAVGFSLMMGSLFYQGLAELPKEDA